MTEQAPHRRWGLSPDRRFLRTASEALAFGFLAVNWLATQLVAARMYYAPFLSGRLIAHVYQPFEWWWWQHRWPNGAVRIGHRVLYLAPMWRGCERLIIYPMLVLGGVAGVCALFMMNLHQAADLHGSAAWANTSDIQKAGLL